MTSDSRCKIPDGFQRKRKGRVALDVVQPINLSKYISRYQLALFQGQDCALPAENPQVSKLLKSARLDRHLMEAKFELQSSRLTHHPHLARFRVGCHGSSRRRHERLNGCISCHSPQGGHGDFDISDTERLVDETSLQAHRPVQEQNPRRILHPRFTWPQSSIKSETLMSRILGHSEEARFSVTFCDGVCDKTTVNVSRLSARLPSGQGSKREYRPEVEEKAITNFGIKSSEGLEPFRCGFDPKCYYTLSTPKLCPASGTSMNILDGECLVDLTLNCRKRLGSVRPDPT
ncbi:hypothetical protein PM082_022301 [Marasmius tenuissimus]|nr:hypothetical protein PM082_022301 [Marasmius tenuissimus]